MNVFDLFAKISLDTSEYEKGLDNASSKVSSFASKLGGGLKSAAKVGAAASAAVVAVGAASVKTGMQFDKSMSQVAATMGVTVDEISNLRDFAQEMGRTTAFSATEAANALNYMALAGYDAETSMQMLPNVLNLAAAGGIDLAYASDMITDSQTALGLSLEETNVLVDQIAKMSSTTNTSVSQLGEAILTVGGTAQFMAGGTEELTSVLGVLADNGIKGSEAGTHLRNMLLKLSSPTDEGAIALENLGVQIFDAEGNMRSFAEIFLDLQSAMSNLTNEQQLQALSAIFNTRDIAAAQALMGTTVDRWDELAVAIDDSAGSADKMAKTQLDNLSGDVTLFKSALEGAQIAISDKLSPSLRDFVQLGTQGLSDITKAFEEGGLEGAMSAFGTFLSDGIVLITSKLPDIVDAGVALLESLLKGIVDNSDKIIAAVVQVTSTLVKAFLKNYPVYIKTGIDIILKLVQGISKELPTLIPVAVEAVITIAEGLIDNISMLIDAAIQLIEGLATGLIDAIPILIDALPTIIDSLINGILDAIPQIIQAGVRLLTALVGALPEIIKKIVQALPQIVDSIITALLENIPLIVQAGIDLLTALVGNIPDIILTIVEALPELITGIIDGILDPDNIDKFISAGIDLFVAIIGDIPKIIEEIVKKLPEIIEGIIKGFGSLLDKMAKLGVEMVKKLWEGISSMGDWIHDKVGGFGSAVLGAITGGLLGGPIGAIGGGIVGAIMGGSDDEGMIKSGSKVGKGSIKPKKITYNDEIGEYEMEDIPVHGGGGRKFDDYDDTTASTNKQVNIVLELDKTQFGKVVFDANNNERIRMGVK